MEENKKTFEEIVRAMSGKEIIMAMVESLKNPVIKVDMTTYGGIAYGDICVGCAATNTICKIAGIVFNADNINTSYKRANAIHSNLDFLSTFEECIDQLRSGYIGNYNNLTKYIDIALITNPLRIDLPRLASDYTEKDLEQYVKLANSQPNER